MRRSFFATLVLCITPVVSPAAAAPTQPFSQLLGTWSCANVAGSVISSTFARTPNGDVEGRYVSRWPSGAQIQSFVQTFSYMTASAQWRVTNQGPGNAIDGVTSGQQGDTITITGVQTLSGQTPRPIRERILFRSPSLFFHIWEAQFRDGAWKPTSFAECSRVQPGTG